MKPLPDPLKPFKSLSGMARAGFAAPPLNPNSTGENPTSGQTTPNEQMMIHCHMALLGIWPASDAWGEVNEWLVENGQSPYAKRQKSVMPKHRNLEVAED